MALWPPHIDSLIVLVFACFAVPAAASATARRPTTPAMSDDVDIVKGSALLQLRSMPTKGGTFGPDGCVSLTRSDIGTCVLSTKCSASANLSGVEFAFVCTNPGANIPHALHSFGLGGFEHEEIFDTAVKCSTCSTVQAAWQKGSPLLRRSLSSKLGEDRISTGDEVLEPEILAVAPATRTGTDTTSASVFGPGACISAYLSNEGSCMIQTRCVGQDLANFDVGFICLDKAGNYTRYSFGRQAFQVEEAFDTRLPCVRCLAVDDQAADGAERHTILPKMLVDDVNNLRAEVRVLRTQVQQGASDNIGSDTVKVEKEGSGGDKAVPSFQDAVAIPLGEPQVTFPVGHAAGSKSAPAPKVPPGLPKPAPLQPKQKATFAHAPKSAFASRPKAGPALPQRDAVSPPVPKPGPGPPRHTAVTSLQAVLERAAAVPV